MRRGSLWPTTTESPARVPEREPDWRVSLNQRQQVDMGSTIAFAEVEARLLAASYAIREMPRVADLKIVIEGWYRPGSERDGAAAFGDLLKLFFPERFASKPWLPADAWDAAVDPDIA